VEDTSQVFDSGIVSGMKSLQVNIKLILENTEEMYDK
jgi:hypothetical protein